MYPSAPRHTRPSRRMRRLCFLEDTTRAVDSACDRWAASVGEKQCDS